MDTWEAEPSALHASPASHVRKRLTDPGTLDAPPAPLWLDVLDQTARACAAHGRADLQRWLRQRRAQLLDPQLRVLVVGEPKQGKSQLVNALLNAPVCVVGDDVGTVLPTVVQHAATPSAFLVRREPDTWERTGAPEDRIRIPVDRAAERISGHAEDTHAHPYTHVEIHVPRALLARGLALIDAPATGGPDPAPAVSALAALTRADIVVLVSEANRELSTTDLDLLAHIAESYPSTLVALTKTDISPRWRWAVDRNRQLLAGAGVPATLVPISATLRLHAARTGDQTLNLESGFPRLVAHLNNAMSTKGTQLTRSAVSLLGRATIKQLAAPLREELSAHGSGDVPEAMSRLRDAQRKVDDLRRCSTRWQHLLSDEIADLTADIEHDLRERTRLILRTVDEAFDAVDPVQVWEGFERWLEAALVDAAEANFSWLAERTAWIAARVAEQFPADGIDVLPRWTVGVPGDLSDRVSRPDRPPVERFTLSQRLFSGLRGSYGGVLMLGLATTLAGMPLINPVSLGAGVVLGGKSIREESRAFRKRRQVAAKAAVQRYVDDVFLRLSKEGRDLIRQVHRGLRDHYGELTEDLQQAIVESARMAKQEADSDASAREQRLRRAEREMARLAELYEQARALGAVPSALIPAQRTPTA